MSKPCILLAFANNFRNYDQYLVALQKEEQALCELLDHLNDIKLLRPAVASVEDILKHISQYHQYIFIFHFAGHADGQHLKMQDLYGQAQNAYAKGLAGVLGQASNLMLVFLNGCATKDQVQLLFDNGVKAVIATSSLIGDIQATKFATYFYMALKDKMTLNQAFDFAVNSIQTRSPQLSIGRYRALANAPDSRKLPWGLYTNGDDPEVLDWTLEKITSSYQSDDSALRVLNQPFYPTHFIGREQELEQIRASLKNSKITVLLNGIGGIGKSTLAQYYFHQALNNNQYDIYRWFNYDGSLKSTLITSLQPFYQIQSNNIDEVFNTILNKEQALTGKKLLVIDNFDRQDAQDELRMFPGWDVLVTTRLNLDGFYQIAVESLPEQQAIEMFYNYCSKLKGKQAENHDELQKLLALIERHTLLVEMIAKAIQRSNLLSIKKVYELLKENRIDNEQMQQLVDIPNKGQRKLIEHLQVLYTLEKLTEDEKWLLKQFAVLPARPIDFELLCDLLQFQDNEEIQASLDQTLAGLHEKGWLRHGNNEGGYLCHPLIRQYVYCFARPVVEECERLVDSINGKLNIDQAKDNPVDKFKWIVFGDSLLDILQTSNAENHHLLSITQNNLANRYFDLGQFEKAKDLLELAFRNDLNNFGQNHSTTAVSQFNLAEVYRNLGQFEKARDLAELALKNDLKNFGQSHSTVAIGQSNLANIYLDLGQFDKARDLLELALNNDLNNFGQNHPNVAIRQSNLASVYRELGQFDKARDLFQEALKSIIDNFGENHPNVAIFYNNLAYVHLAQNNISQAKEYFQKAYQIALNTLGENHPNTQTFKQALDDLP